LFQRIEKILVKAEAAHELRSAAPPQPKICPPNAPKNAKEKMKLTPECLASFGVFGGSFL
jgi:hypothetical protein